MFGISPGSLLIILVIVLLVFGTKRLKNIGGDLGGAIKGFKAALKEGEDTTTSAEKQSTNQLSEPVDHDDTKTRHTNRSSD